MTSIRRLAFVLWLLVVLTSSLLSQVATGNPPFGSFGGGPFDSVNLGNLNAHLPIPIVHKAGRGTPFDYSLSYDTSVWYPAGVSGSQTWTPVYNWGWRAITEMSVGYMSYFTNTLRCPGTGIHDGLFYTTWANFQYHDPYGATHRFPGTAKDSTDCPTNPVLQDLNAVASDGSGFTYVLCLSGSCPPTGLTARGGAIINAPVNIGTGAGSFTDSNGNQISVTAGGVFTDTLNTSALTVAGSGTPASPETFTYKGPSGNVAYTMHFTNQTVKTNFACSGVAEYGPTVNPLVSDITLPDNSQYLFTYEPTPGFSGDVTGRLKSVTLPTGGVITYTYTGANQGIVCADGSAAGLTRQVNPGGTWTYTRSGSGTSWTTTVADPSSNETVINFAEDSNTANPNNNFYETQRLVYQGSHTSGTLLLTTYNCWDNNFTNCATQAVISPITQLDHYTQPPGLSAAQSETKYNTYGLLTEDKEFDYGSVLVSDKIITYATLGNGIFDRPSSIVTKDASGNTKSQVTYFYDETAVTTTTGTPQHVAVSGSRGNVTSMGRQVSGSTTLYNTFSYFDTGTVNTATDISLSKTSPGASTSYVYGTGDCGNSFPTQVNEPLSLSRSMTWNCDGAVLLSTTDENGKIVTTNYTDANFWRPSSVVDQLTNQTNIAYTGQTVVESSLSFNSGGSISDLRSTVDGFGRPILSQRRQGPGATNYDSIETDYDSAGRPSRTTVPYSATAGTTSPSSPATTTGYDALNRPTGFTDGGGGTVSYSYTKNDVLQTVGPAPSGESTKKKQLEYDGMGRLTSVCEITSVSGSGSCIQSSSSPIGYWTKYFYDTLGHLTGVTQNAQAVAGSQQSRTFGYDMLGRLTSEANPESGTTTYSYDSLTSDASCGTVSAPGNLVKKVDAMGNVTCLTYDTLHRVTSQTYPTGPYASTTKRFYVYDSATVNGATMSNAKTRLAEAYTCTSCPATKITDLGFSYSARGELADVYQSTPNSVGFYHTTAAYYPNGALNSLSGVPGQTAWTFGVDAEGRPTSAAQGATNLVTGVAFNTASQPTMISFAQGDSDSYEYDPNTGRMTKYTFTVGSAPQSMVGVLTWNLNGTLSKQAITDGFNASGAQTCKYGDPTASVAGYDDLGRLIKVDCGLSMWQQNFSYDAFGNITKNVPAGAAGINWIPGYSSATNRYTLGGATYDLDGNLTNDSFHTHWWNTEGKIASIGSATCGGSGVICLTYDALGRVVERQNGAAFTEFLYSPIGKTATMTGQTLTNAAIPLPGGTRLYYATATNKQLWHKDWLGSVRLTSSFSSRTIVADRAVAPYGEPYNVVTGGGANMFAQNEQAIFTVSASASQPYDTPNREVHPTQGRWLSPDPAGMSAVNLANPQTWNRYAYVAGNPLAATDPSGLKLCPECHFLGGGTSSMGCSADGVDAGCDLVMAMLGPQSFPGDTSTGGAVQCPDNNCGVGTSKPFQCIDSVCGYMNNQYAATHRNEWNGVLYSDSEWQAFLSDRVDAQRQALADAISYASASPDGSNWDYIYAHLNAYDQNGNLQIQGGNVDFTWNGSQNLLAFVSPTAWATGGCTWCRYGNMGQVHFHNEAFHLDTASPIWGFGLGAFLHGFVDVGLNNLNPSVP